MTHHAHNHNWAVLQVDVRNGFNSIDRQAMLDAAHDRIPKLVSWTNYCYAAHSKLFLSNGHPISSQQGVQQGDPLGLLMYSLAWQSVVDKMPKGLLLNLWYLDDGHLVGPQAVLEEALNILHTEGAKIGITLNADKCVLWGPAAQGASGRLAEIPITPWQRDSGIKVLGLPVCFPGSHGFAEKMMTKVIDKVEESCSVLLSLGDPQIQHLLLRYCLDACTVMHYLRGVDCTHLQHLVQRCSTVVKRTWAYIVGASNLSNEE